MNFRDLSSCIILLDFNNQVWRNFHATEKQNLKNSDGINTGCIIGLMKVLNYSIKKAKENFSTPKLVICEDRYPTNKHKLYEDNQSAFQDYPKPVKYKGTRKKKDYPYNPIEICKQFVDCLPHIKLWADGEEADDMIATFVSKNPNKKIFLYSTDRDLWQLIPKYPNLEIVLGDGKSPDKEKIKKSFKCDMPFEKIFLFKVIKGDSGDNIKSINNFRFKHTLESFNRCDGTIEDYIKCIGEDFGTDSKYFQQLINNSELIRLNSKAIRLKENVKTYHKQIIEKPDIDKWRKLCMVFETPSIVNSPLLRIF